MHETQQTQTRPVFRMMSLAAGGLAAAFLALAPTAAPAANDPILTQLAGSWVGRGTLRQSANGKPEQVYCKITNKLASGGAALEQKGRCAIATNSGAIKGTITAGSGGSYNGTLDTFSTKGPAKIAGKAASNTINFNAEFVDRRTNKPTKATIQLVVADGKYRLVSNAPNDAFVASDITFTPQ